MSARQYRHGLTILVLVLLPLCGAARRAGAQGLTDVEFTGYLAWLGTLLPTGAPGATHDAASGDATCRFPFGVAALAEPTALDYPADPSVDDGHADHHGKHPAAAGHGGAPAAGADPLVQSSRGLIELEHAWSRPRDRQAITADEALRAARLYGSVAEYDSALVWYQHAEALDAMGLLRPAIGREALAMAVAGGDSNQVARQLWRQLVGTPDDAAAVIGLRYLIVHRDDDALRRLADAAAAGGSHDPSLTVWLAYARRTLGDWPACLLGLRSLLAAGAPADGIDGRLRAWVLVTVPDLLFLTGDHEGAAALYRALAASKIAGVATWATLQGASLDLLAGRHAAAHTTFAALCADPQTAPWQEFACEMARHSEQFTRFGVEAVADGTSHDDDH